MSTTSKTTSRKSPAKSAARAAVTNDAIGKLKSDHALVKKLFDTYEKNKEKMSSDEKSDMVAQICGELKVHATIEEEIFYPAVRQTQDEVEELKDLLDEAEVEHAGAKDLIAQLEGATPEQPLYDAKVTVLGEYVKHHADEEETEMFPKVKKAKVLDLEDLGEQLISRAEELKGEFGLN